MKQFASFRLDTQNQCLWRDGVQVPVTPKPFAVLCYLVDHAQQLVTHDELLDALWPETYVQPQVLRTYVLELRKLLGDDAAHPRFIATQPKRGYRFLAAVSEVAPPPVAGSGGHAYAAPPPDARSLSGRERELEHLTAAAALARGAERQVIFLAGDAGRGKTALLDLFSWQLGAAGARVVRGQSVEGFAGKEPFYPVTEQLRQLVALPDGEAIGGVLARLAPGWYARLTAQSAPTAARELLLGELCDALEALAQERLLVLVFEDLHWADEWTLDLLSALARRRGPAPMLVLGSFRPAESAAADHPLRQLRQDLATRRLASVIPLPPLDRRAVTDFVSRELAGKGKIDADLASRTAAFLLRQSEGNPLFLRATFEHLLERRALVLEDGGWRLAGALDSSELGIPGSLSEMVGLQVERLEDDDRSLLEAGSLIGLVFPVWGVAAVLGAETDELEERFERLARQIPFLRAGGTEEAPGHGRSTFYVFAHSVYREVLERRQPETRRARGHRRIAERMLQMFAGNEALIAAQAAMHLEQAGEWRMACDALCLGADNARATGAEDLATELMENARRILRHLGSRDRAGCEAQIQQWTRKRSQGGGR